METLRWGILSTANIGLNAVIPATQAAARCDVVAIASRDGRRAEDAAARLGIPRSLGSYDDLLADPEIDAVYNPLPNHLHAPLTIAALEAGKHVLCEKPIALTAAEAREMAAAAERTGMVLVEAFMYRLHPAWVTARDLIAAGRIGEVVTVDASFFYFNDDPADIRNIAEYGGGGLMDIGCYPINLSRMLFGSEPTGVAAAITRDPASGVDVLASAVLEFGDRTATFSCGTRAGAEQRVAIMGTEGRIVLTSPFNPPPEGSEVHVWRGNLVPGDPPDEVLRMGRVDQYTLQAEAFAATVLDGAPPHLSLDDSIANMEVIERVFAAAG